ncbi:hypothetical protein CIB95_01965 [Lottiidibacillus patelloidae]|uniref:Type I restriction modification DNA specificity domain-containing protein n=1 Tax=Lottiidibacillus patelloidae TaxID=2670334 RepID=A0A263BXH1_9BACI|nr:restriction endonuclease subunit S [Lottiidibacillus patelloidae]OZM58360.1 hypothetical protein CIB95_01965 [Lottiidibacillus patelloidae]
MVSDMIGQTSKNNVLIDVPEKWEVVKIEDIFKAIDGDRGKNYPNEKDFLSNGYCLFLDTKNVTKTGFSFKTKKFISEEKENTLRNGKLERNDIVMTSRGTIGNISFFDETVPFENIRINSAMLILRAKVDDIIYKYWMQLLRGKVIEEFIRRAKVGSAQPHITKKSLNSLKVAIPSRKEEQTKIAAILSSVDNAIEKTEAIIEQTEKVKKGLMQQLLTKGIGHTRFKKTEIGEIPVEWEVQTLEEVSLGKGEYGIGAKATEYRANQPRYLRITDIDDRGKLIPSDKKGIAEENYERYLLEYGDIVFARTGNTTGKSYLYDDKDGSLVFAGFLIRFKLNKEIVNPMFISSIVNTKYYWNWVKVMSTRSGQPGINGNEYSSFMVPVPSLLEQDKIASMLSIFDEKIEKETRFYQKLNTLKKGLMQVLLTGKVRVKVDENEVVST